MPHVYKTPTIMGDPCKKFAHFPSSNCEFISVRLFIKIKYAMPGGPVGTTQ